jgi:hypothetical protein
MSISDLPAIRACFCRKTPRCLGDGIESLKRWRDVAHILKVWIEKKRKNDDALMAICEQLQRWHDFVALNTIPQNAVTLTHFSL